MNDNKITHIQIEMAELKADVKHIKENLDNHIEKEEEHLRSLNETIDKWFSTADKRYASKDFEKFFIKIGWIIISMVVPAILYTAWAMVEHVRLDK